jgi:OmpA-OmpF porin, OOP family
MRRNRFSEHLGLALICVALTATLPLMAGDKPEIKGLITGRTGETLTVKTAEGTNVTVVLSDDTTVQQPKGLGIRKKQMSMAALVPGLRITVKGAPDANNRFLAETITFSKDDLQTAEQIQAGLVPTQQNVAANQQAIEENKAGIASNQSQITANQQQNQQQIAANQQEIQDTNKRFSELSDYDTKGELNVYFAAGSTAISAKDKAALGDLAHKAVNLTGYIVQVKGFADSSGNAAMNQKLSMERAQNVIAYLIQTCNIPVRHVVAPGAMGEADPAATNETAQGRSENRRVEVKVLVNRGLAGN